VLKTKGENLGLAMINLRRIMRILITLTLSILCAVPLTAQSPVNSTAAFAETTTAILAGRNLILAGTEPSTVTPVITKLEAALNGIANAKAALAGVSNLGGWGFPAPVITDPFAYAKAQLASANTNLNAAATLTTDTATLAAISAARSYLSRIPLAVSSPPALLSRILFSLYESNYDLSQEEGPTVTDIARNDSSSIPLVQGLWAGVEFIRGDLFVCWGLMSGETGWPIPTKRNALDCMTQPRQCAAQILLFPGASPEEHGLPYFFRNEMLYFSSASMSLADGVNTLKMHPRAWSASDDAGYRITQLP
jgi:hypothetical protein